MNWGQNNLGPAIGISPNQHMKATTGKEKSPQTVHLRRSLCFWTTTLVSLCLMPTLLADTLVVGVSNGRNNAPFNLAGSFGVSPSQRYQQYYDPASFGPMAGGAWITELDFRVCRGEPSFSSVLPDIQINLSTSPKTLTSLSKTYSANVGADDLIVVPRGPLALSGTGGVGPNPFDIVITLTHPFFYNPSNGGLLLDVRNWGGGATSVFDADELPSSIMNRVYNYQGTADSTTADVIGLNYAGLVTRFQFTPIPEPAIGSLFTLSLLLLASKQPGRIRLFC